MSLSQIQVSIKNALLKQIMEFFIDFYSSETSPFLPICILASVVDHALLTDPITYSLTNWRVAQLSENKVDASRKLARITLAEYPVGFTLIFEFVEFYRNSGTTLIKNVQQKLV